MTVSAETRAYWQELGGYYAAAERNGTDHTHPAKPPTADVAFDVSAICAESITLLMDDRPASSPPPPTQTRPSNLSLRPVGSPIGRCRSGVSDGGLGHPSAAAVQAGDQRIAQRDKAVRRDRRNRVNRLVVILITSLRISGVTKPGKRSPSSSSSS
jgi:hypothetical protein